MEALVTREYCRRHPGEIARLFGPAVLVQVLLSPRRTLLEALTERYRRHRVPLPGAPGRAYCVSALIEQAVAAFYRGVARRFAGTPAVAALFEHLAAEEDEHARLMIACLYTARLGPATTYVPTVRDPEVRALLARLRALRRRVAEMDLEEALAAAEELERGEANVIFERLLRQAGTPEAEFFRRHLAAAEGHAEYVPRRLAELRRTLEGSG